MRSCIDNTSMRELPMHLVQELNVGTVTEFLFKDYIKPVLYV